MLIGRRSLLAGTAALPLFAVKRARAAEFTFRAGVNLPPAHPLCIRAQEACIRIAAATDGRAEIKLYPASGLGGDTDVLKKTRDGEVEMFFVSGLPMSSVIPAAAVYGIGFAFKTYRQVWGALDGRLGAFLKQETASIGLETIGRIWNNGFRQTTSSKSAIRSPDDYSGLKLRTPISPLSLSMFRALGAQPAGLNLSEVYAALQSRAMDGQENPLAIIQAAKFYEVQTFCSLTNHMWDGYWLTVNSGLWRGLPQRVRDIMEQEFDRSCQDERDDLTRQNPGQRGDLVQAGLEVNAVAPSDFQAVLQRAGFYTEWKAKFGETAWRLLEETAGPLS